MNIGLLLLRVVVGSLFFGHGTQKLFGWFGGYGPDGTGGYFSSLGYRKGRTMAIVAGFTEATSGALLAVGWLTPFAAAGIIGVMFNAIVAAHRQNGMWNQDGGMEYPIVNATAAACLAFAGPGAYSVDEALNLGLGGAEWGASAVLLGLITGSIVALSRRPAPAAQEQAMEEERRRAA